MTLKSGFCFTVKQAKALCGVPLLSGEGVCFTKRLTHPCSHTGLRAPLSKGGTKKLNNL
jgi:hypothetical protein